MTADPPIRPQRIQRKRTRGWQMPSGAVYVGRRTRWGNPYRFDGTLPQVIRHDDGETFWMSNSGAHEMFVDAEGRFGWYYPEGSAYESLVALYRQDLLAATLTSGGRFPISHVEAQAELRGRDLACWCPLAQPCHADVLLEIANPS